MCSFAPVFDGVPDELLHGRRAARIGHRPHLDPRDQSVTDGDLRGALA